MGPETPLFVAAPVRHLCVLLRQRLDQLEIRTGVLLGCGDGNEVVYLRRVLKSRHVVGLDAHVGFSPLARAEADLVAGDAQRLPFPADSFDFAAAIHSLEHMGDPRLALAEVRRVLRPGAWLYIGVPNKTRLLGYVGSPFASLWEKLRWNLDDYRHRLLGLFENRLGAHAGFRADELLDLLQGYFSGVRLVTREYVGFKYRGRLPRRVLNLLLAPRTINYAAPAHYALCHKD